MSKTSKQAAPKGDAMRPEYDFSSGIRGKYANRFRPDTVMVTLAPDVAEAFPDAKSVNEALRILMKAARKTSKKVAPAA
jgi:hypothetical protein